MAFDLKKLDGRTWQIFDQQDRMLYSGSLESCRDWLDLQEGRQQRTLYQVVSGWFSKSAHATQKLTSTSQSTSESGVLS